MILIFRSSFLRLFICIICNESLGYSNLDKLEICSHSVRSPLRLRIQIKCPFRIEITFDYPDKFNQIKHEALQFRIWDFFLKILHDNWIEFSPLLKYFQKKMHWNVPLNAMNPLNCIFLRKIILNRLSNVFQQQSILYRYSIAHHFLLNIFHL